MLTDRFGVSGSLNTRGISAPTKVFLTLSTEIEVLKVFDFDSTGDGV